MEVRFILKDNVTESQQQMIESLNNLSLDERKSSTT